MTLSRKEMNRKAGKLGAENRREKTGILVFLWLRK